MFDEIEFFPENKFRSAGLLLKVISSNPDFLFQSSQNVKVSVS